jgi:peptidoglycan/LPS O-acetylase OafA/YrhL
LKPTATKRITELDAMRGIAALLVVLFHLTLSRKEAAYGFELGVTGVDLFFIISGFVILMTVEKTKHWKDFIVSRVSRIYPTYWTCVTLTALFLLFTQHIPMLWFALKYTINMTMFQVYFHIPDIDGPYWTMIIEMLFYIFMLSLLIMKKLHRIEAIGAALLVPVFFYGHYLNGISPRLMHLLGTYLPLINHFPLFYAGILFYKIRFDKPSVFRYVMLGVCFALQLSLFHVGGRSSGVITETQYVCMLGTYFTLFILYVNNLLGFIVNKATLFLGSVSFGLYLVHQYLCLNILLPFATGRLHLNFFCAAFLFALPVVLLLAYLIHIIVEKPAMDAIRAWYKARKADSLS